MFKIHCNAWNKCSKRAYNTRLQPLARILVLMQRWNQRVSAFTFKMAYCLTIVNGFKMGLHGCSQDYVNRNWLQKNQRQASLGRLLTTSHCLVSWGSCACWNGKKNGYYCRMVTCSWALHPPWRYRHPTLTYGHFIHLLWIFSWEHGTILCMYSMHSMHAEGGNHFWLCHLLTTFWPFVLVSRQQLRKMPRKRPHLCTECNRIISLLHCRSCDLHSCLSQAYFVPDESHFLLPKMKMWF